MVLISKPKLILLDIEGTTSSISFVKQILFPFVKTNIKQYLLKNWGDPLLQQDIDLLRKQSLTDKLDNDLSDVPIIAEQTDGSQIMIESVIENVLWQMSADRKTTSLKQFQGNLWRFGYESEDIKGHVYSDVPKAMSLWKHKYGIKICIYSSGSILAQKLLFRYSVFNDLTSLIDDYFDTTIGPKIESESYTKIAKTCDLNPNEILFITDLANEAIAAKNAGINAILSIRDGTLPLTEDVFTQFQTIKSFEEIDFKE